MSEEGEPHPKKMKPRDHAVTHKIMSSIKGKDTKPELLLRKALWRRNHRYRTNVKTLPGKPDIVFTKYKVAVFCDGDFWHGHNWAIRGKGSLDEELSSYSEFWRAKIQRNVERDREIDRDLILMGWSVVRVWESDIKKDLDACVKVVEDALFDAMIERFED